MVAAAIRAPATDIKNGTSRRILKFQQASSSLPFSHSAPLLNSTIRTCHCGTQDIPAMSSVLAFIRALNQKIRSNKVSDYFCSTRMLEFLLPLNGGACRFIVPCWVGSLSSAELCLRVADFWGPASNFGIPIAAILDTYKSPDL